MQKYLSRELIIDALNMTIANLRPGLILNINSDSGSQYASSDYQQLLWQHGFICSMSRWVVVRTIPHGELLILTRGKIR